MLIVFIGERTAFLSLLRSEELLSFATFWTLDALNPSNSINVLFLPFADFIFPTTVGLFSGLGGLIRNLRVTDGVGSSCNVGVVTPELEAAVRVSGVSRSSSSMSRVAALADIVGEVGVTRS